jgi:hypothetical protein
MAFSDPELAKVALFASTKRRPGTIFIQDREPSVKTTPTEERFG